MQHCLSSMSIQVLFAVSLGAQSVAVTTSAVTPIAVHVSLSGQNTTSTQPVGPLPAQGIVQASLGTPGAHAEGFARWSTDLSATATKVWLSNVLIGDPGLPNSVSIPPHAFLVSFTGSAPGVLCDLELFHFSNYTPGAVLPRIDIDLDNDGVLDWGGLPQGTTTWPLVALAAQPKLVRIVMSAQLPGPGTSLTTFSIALKPHNDVAMTQLVSGCAPGYGEMIPPVQVFADRGIDVRVLAGEDAGLNVYVIGLSQQPQPLPPQTTPCLLLPSPDILIAQWGPLHIALPAVVRPVTFYMQGFEIGQPAYPGQGPYSVTSGFGITAF